jgi:uncharacterized protein
MSIQAFPPSVAEKLNYYVYMLVDPQDEKVFYVGKGIGDRVFHHAIAAIMESTPSEKLDRIRAIRAQGLEVNYFMLRHGLEENEAFEVEAALIDFLSLSTLTNKVSGYYSDERGLMSVEDIIEKYAAPEVEIIEPVMLITINRLYRKNMSADELYDITRGYWVVGERRKKARYGMAVYNGIIREVYEIDNWQPMDKDLPELKNKKRWFFNGKVAHDIRGKYVGGSIARYTPKKGAQNPIRYVNC